MIINVALPIPIFKTFTYKVTNYTNPIIGARVLVPFGKKKIIGIITDVNTSSKLFIDNIKYIIYIFDKKSLFTPSLWNIIKLGSQYYHYPIGLALFSILPKQIKNGQPINQPQTLIITQLNTITIEKNLICTKKQKIILNYLINQPIYQNIINLSNRSIKILKILHKKKLCKLYFNTLVSEFWYKNYSKSLHEININPSYNLFENISNFSVTVISNIKDSDKVKIFLNAIKNILKYKKQVLILVPETVLIFKLLTLLENKINFPIGVMYSSLNDKVKFNTWLNIYFNNVPIVIGTKDSLFIPFTKLGLIIVDDEHNILYKINYKWCYNARDLAILRAKIDNIPIILSSLTPSLETINNIKKNKYKQILVNKNYLDNIINISLVGTNNLQVNKLSPILINKIKFYLQNNNQILIFINTLNTKLVLQCNTCKYIISCSICKQYYKYDKYYNKLKCYSCNILVIIPNNCQLCNNKLNFINININNFKQLLSNVFPNKLIFDLDYLNNYKDNIIDNTDIVISNTLFLSKKYYFVKNTLIILMNVDNILFSKNFKYTEYFIQLYNQLINYINKKYEIIIQTNFPNHPLIQQLINTNYYNIIEYILNNRKLAKLPPFNFHILIKAISNNQAKLFLLELKQMLNNVVKNKIIIIGPLYSYYFKLKNYFYWYLLLSSKSRNILHTIINKYYSYICAISNKYKISWLIDVDPVHY